MITIASIQRAVADHYGVPFAKMREPRNNGGESRWEFARPRQVAMCLAIRLTDHHYTTVGRHFGGRHSTTVLHASRETIKRSHADPALRQAMRRITLELVR